MYIPKECTALKRQRLLKDFSVFDIETDEWAKPKDIALMSEKEIQAWHGKNIRPFLIVHWDGETPDYFRGKNCVHDFIKFALKFQWRAPHLFFAHNGGKFDFLPIFHHIRSEFPQFHMPPPFMQHARIMTMKVHDRNNHIWQFRDSYSLLQHSLEKLTKGFGVSHIKMKQPKDKDDRQIPYDQAPDDWNRYCLNDCIGLFEVLKSFSSVMGELKGTIGCSAASSAIGTWRLSYLKCPISTYFQHNQIFRNAFYGGRTEIFNQFANEDEAPFYDYDVNSMYPSVMHDNLFPVSIPISVKYTDPNDVRGRLGIMECEVTAPDDLNIPFLPYHYNKKLLFPIGSWKGFYDFCEIEKALDLGYKIKPERTWEFEGDYIWKDFIEALYPLKQNSKGAKAETAKLLMNSSFGKTGERDIQPKLVEGGDYLGLRPYDFIYGYASKNEFRPSPYHLPANALRVTALARVKIYNLIEQVIARKGTNYYMDTDSLICNVRLPTSKNLGDIKLHHEFRRGIFLQPKLYFFEPYEYHYDDEGNLLYDFSASKGFSFDFKRKLSFKLLEDALLTGNYDKLNETVVRPSSLRESSKRKIYGWTTIVQLRSVRNTYDKRIVNPDFSTIPLTVPFPITPEPEPKPELTGYERIYPLEDWYKYQDEPD